MHIYESPLTEAIAGICGLYTLLPGCVEAHSEGEDARVRIADKSFPVTLTQTPEQNHLSTEVLFLLRPEWAEIARNPSQEKEGFIAKVDQVLYQGAMTEYELTTQVGKIHYRALGLPMASVGEEVYWSPRRLHVLTGQRQ
jgi:ABC-type Fe3+/spermidine/putrescine transport system ATPase subunit